MVPNNVTMDGIKHFNIPTTSAYSAFGSYLDKFVIPSKFDLDLNN